MNAAFLAGACVSLSLIVTNAIAQQFVWQRDTPFISPIESRLTLPYSDPRLRSLCRDRDRSKCPKLLVYGGNTQGGLPVLDPVLKARAPHVRVSFVLQRIQVVGDAAAWMDSGDVDGDFYWETHSAAADQENGSFHIWFDGEVDAAGYMNTPPVIYDALVLNGCNGFSSFPVVHDADFDDSYGAVTPFHGVDNSTLDSTGFYNFSYIIHVDAEPGDGEAHSGLLLSGKVNATCTATSSL